MSDAVNLFLQGQEWISQGLGAVFKDAEGNATIVRPVVRCPGMVAWEVETEGQVHKAGKISTSIAGEGKSLRIVGHMQYTVFTTTTQKPFEVIIPGSTLFSVRPAVDEPITSLPPSDVRPDWEEEIMDTVDTLGGMLDRAIAEAGTGAGHYSSLLRQLTQWKAEALGRLCRCASPAMRTPLPSAPIFGRLRALRA